VTRQMHSLSGTSSAFASDGIMGASPSATLSASDTTTSQPPPPLSHSSDRIPRGNQVNSRLLAQDLGHGEGDRTDARTPWMPKMDFSMFDGTDVHVWLDKCLAYFALYQIPAAFQVSVASLHMTGVAAHWFQTYKLTTGFQLWDQFASAVSSEFEGDVHRAKTMELSSLKQKGLMEGYRREFEQLVYHIRLYDNSISSTMLTAQFLLGLNEELRTQVEMQLPESVAKATILAAIQEKLMDKMQKKPIRTFGAK
jgi:hypothetical protein